MMKVDFVVGIVFMIEVTFYTYMNIFLMYLILMFAKENKIAEVKDPVLGRSVPNIVFL